MNEVQIFKDFEFGEIRVTTAALTAASISSVFAGVNVENYDLFEVNDSEMGTVVKQSTNLTNIYGHDINIKDIKERSINGSLIGTYIGSSYSETNAAGRNINYAGIDLTEIKRSEIGTAVKDKTDIKNFFER